MPVACRRNRLCSRRRNNPHEISPHEHRLFMGSRGKQSTAGIAIKPVATLRTRLPVPAGLTPAQAATWRAVVASRPVDWFDGGSAPLLVQYCRCVAVQDALAAAINDFDPNPL